jgi:hypothetical protein
MTGTSSAIENIRSTSRQLVRERGFISGRFAEQTCRRRRRMPKLKSMPRAFPLPILVKPY